MDMPDITAMRRAAARRLPRALFDYVDGGAWEEATLRANRCDLASVLVHPRVGVDVNTIDLSTRLFGRRFSLPVILGPAGLAGCLWPRGEAEAHQAAVAAGTCYVAPLMSLLSIEQIAAVADEPPWFQTYILHDPAFTTALLARLIRLEIDVLMITLDAPVIGVRKRDLHHQFGWPMRPTPRGLLDLARRPAWLAGQLQTGSRGFGNIIGHAAGVSSMRAFGEWNRDTLVRGVSWERLRDIRDAWPGRLLVKGVMHPDDALAALKIGADGVVVSNHGGRQLDSAPSTVSALKAIRAVVPRDRTLLIDSGFRDGLDVLKALALGADAVMIARGFLYGLSNAGKHGVERVIDIFRRDLAAAMQLTGCCSRRLIGPDLIARAPIAPSFASTSNASL